jgi:hypothetical protein
MRDLGDLIGLPRRVPAPGGHDMRAGDPALDQLAQQWGELHRDLLSVQSHMGDMADALHELVESTRRKDRQLVSRQLNPITGASAGEKVTFATLGYRYSRIFWPAVTGITYVVEIGGYISAAFTPVLGWAPWNMPEGSQIWLAGGGPQMVVFELLDDVPSS